MPLEHLSIAGYRSVRDLQLPLRQVNVLTGPNGCGKSNLYNAVFLLAKAARGGLAHAIADEGGMPSILYAGAEGKRLTRKAPPRRVILSVKTDLFDYNLQLGLPKCGPPEASSLFLRDPQVKEESIRLSGGGARPVLMLDREGSSAHIRDDDGAMVTYPLALDSGESTLAQISEPHRYPEVSQLREQMRRWRFYHAFRTDAASPLRRPRVGVMTPVLDHDGSDLAAALRTVVEIGDAEALEEAVSSAFGGARLDITSDETRFCLQMHMPGVQRPLDAAELSDRTLRFLCVVAALLSPRPPELLALNEPETSLHPDLLPALAALIGKASGHSQLWVTTHSPILTDAIERKTGEAAIRLALKEGETVLAG